jgi:hypothetical protein
MIDESTPLTVLPRFLVCEDGHEYLERFERFLGSDFEFIQSRDLDSLLAQLAHRQPIAGILLDLDFRRTDKERLVNGDGRPIALLGKEECARLVANQGIAILASLRRRGFATPVLLFADIDEPQQREYLSQKFAPVELVSSHVGLSELKRRLEELGK